MEGRQEGVEPLDCAHDLSSLSGEVEEVAWGDRSMQQCPDPVHRCIQFASPSPATPYRWGVRPASPSSTPSGGRPRPDGFAARVRSSGRPGRG
jgi:hypothetical protein